MGAIASRDTRRISFDNSFSLSTPINIEKSIEIENAIAFDNIPSEPSSQLLFNENFTELGEEGDGDYWTHRVDYLKKEHQQINQILETEYDKNISATTFNYESPKTAHEKMQKIKPCFDWREKTGGVAWRDGTATRRQRDGSGHTASAITFRPAASRHAGREILKCYEENSRQPLICSSAVQAFANCVSNLRSED